MIVRDGRATLTEIVTASFHEVEGVKIVFQVVKFAADKWLDSSKQREALADCNSRLDDCPRRSQPVCSAEASSRLRAPISSRCFAHRLDVRYDHAAFTGLI